MKIFIALLSLFLISCASTKQPQELFNEYCQNGKQIKEHGFDVELVQMKVRGATSTQASLYWSMVTDKFTKEWWWNDFSRGYYEVTDDQDFSKILENYKVLTHDSLYYFVEFSLFRTEGGVFILAPTEIAEKSPVTTGVKWQPKLQKHEIITMFNEYVLSTKARSAEAYAEDYTRNGDQSLHVYWHDEADSRVQIAPTQRGIRKAVSYDLSPYCKNALPVGDFLAQ